MYKYLLLFALFLTATPALAASTHVYTCSDLNHIDAGGSCAANIWTGNNYSAYGDPTGFDLTPGTWYVSVTITTNHGQIDCYSPGHGNCTPLTLDPGTYTAQSFTIPSGYSATTLLMGGFGGVSWGFEDLCITDTVGACEGGGGGGGGGGDTLTSGFGTSTISVDKTPDVWFQGFFLFLLSIAGSYSLFRPRH